MMSRPVLFFSSEISRRSDCLHTLKLPRALLFRIGATCLCAEMKVLITPWA